MITCPKCNASLPDWSQSCQFCLADTSKQARPVAVAKPKYKREMASWIWPAYYTVAIYWVISGLQGILQALNVGPFASTLVIEGIKIEPGVSIVGLVLGAVTILMGVGLLLKVEFIRGVTNVLCFICIVNGLLGLWGGVLASAFLGGVGLLITIFSLLDIITGGLMIYVLGETD